MPEFSETHRSWDSTGARTAGERNRHRLAATPRHTALTNGPADRFLTLRMGIALGGYLLFAVTFAAFQVHGDGLIYFNFMRRFFGERPEFAYAYQFGMDVWNAPFFLLFKGLGAVFGQEPKIFHVTFEEISVTVAASCALVLTLYLGWRLLREFGLPRGPAVLFLTVFGTPLWYYVVFTPSYKHAADTLCLTAAAWFLPRQNGATAARYAALGGVLGVLVSVRYANIAVAGALLLLLAARRESQGLLTASFVATAVALAIAVLPILRGIPYHGSSGALQAPAVRVAAPADGIPLATSPLHWMRFDAAVPVKMLVSEKRGLFLWTPLTALSVIGYVLLVRRDRQRRGYLLALALGAFLLLCVHSVWASFWTGGFSFSQRFLTALFPCYLLGVSELVRRFRAAAYAVLGAAVGFSVFVGFVHHYGYDNSGAQDGVGRVVQAGWSNRHGIRLEIQDDAKARWRYIGGLLHGEDPEHVHGSS